jgi:hypothetical protein
MSYAIHEIVASQLCSAMEIVLGNRLQLNVPPLQTNNEPINYVQQCTASEAECRSLSDQAVIQTFHYVTDIYLTS